MIGVLIASKDGRHPRGMEHIHWTYKLCVDTQPGWALASNALLDRSCRAGCDALFLDDDVTLTEDTFRLLPDYLDKADVFGFTLVDGSRIVSAGHELYPDGALLPRLPSLVGTPAYLAHVTASALYIKHRVLVAGVRFPVWSGVHAEDIAFTYDVWLHGFRVAYIPGRVEHPMPAGNVGQTKAQTPGLAEKLAQNTALLWQWMREREVMAAARAGRIPFGSMGI
jgi:hypothetical protein